MHLLSLVSIVGQNNSKNVPGSDIGPSRDESTASSISTHSTHRAIRKPVTSTNNGPQPDQLKASDIPDHDILDLAQTDGPNGAKRPNDETVTTTPSFSALPPSDTATDGVSGASASRKRSNTTGDTDCDSVTAYKCSKLVVDQQNLALETENQRLKARLAKAQSNEHDRKLEAEGDGTY